MVNYNPFYAVSIKPQSREAELQLVLQMKNGNDSARETLILSNIRFAISEARKYLGHGLSWEDLCSEAIAGLIKAVDHFDPSRNARLITCAVQWIRNEILLSINKCGYTQRLSNEDFRSLISLKKVLSRYQNIDDESEKISNAAKECGINQKKADNLLQKSSPFTSLDAIEDFANMFSDNGSLSPENNTVNECFKKDFYKALKNLPEVEQNIFVLHHGIAGNEKHSLTQLGEKYGHTKQWAFQKVQSASRALVKELNNWIA